MFDIVLWWTNMACNFSCDYCWQEQNQQHGKLMPVKYRSSKEWIQAWGKIDAKVVDITGGEPFLMPDFENIAQFISRKSRIAITTNLSKPLDKFIDIVNPSDVVVITCSYHPLEYAKGSSRMSDDLFLGRCLLLKNRGYNVNVNFVAYRDLLHLAPEYKDRFNSRGISFHVDPYVPTEHVDFRYTDNEIKFLETLLTPNRYRAMMEGIGGRIGEVLCSAGTNYVMVWQDGTVWRCLRDMEMKINCLGNCLDGTFSPLSERLSCSVSHVCAGCDRDKIVVEIANAG